jgi:two-component system response regulator HupR/HoxA
MASENKQSTPIGRTKVLVIDDEPALLDVMRQEMGGEFDLETATSAAAAEQLIATRRYAVVVCDHVMPGEAGLDFLVRLYERAPEIRRILLTGYMNPELISRSFAVARVSACLLKPINYAELTKAVRAAAAE